MKNNHQESAHYLKLVEWSSEDQCYVGRCPGLFIGGCHGDDETAVYAELCQIVNDVIADMKAGKESLPAATAGKEYSGKFILRTNPQLHQRLSIAAMLRHQSLNKYCIEQLELTTH